MSEYDPFVVIKCWNCDTDRWQGIGPCSTCGAPARIDLDAAVAGSATPTRCHECDGRGHTWEFSRDGFLTCDWCGGSGEEPTGDDDD